MSTDRLISVVMTAYNAGAYLDPAIASVLAQTHDHLELIVVDDGSTDGSDEVTRAFARRDTRVRPVFVHHVGHGAAANLGIRTARGAFIARLDHDDEMLPERLATQLAWLETTGADLCGSQAEIFGAEDGVYWFPESHDAIRVELLFRPSVLQPSMLARAAVLTAHPYLEDVYLDDYELLTRLAFACRLSNVPTVLQRYRRHANQTHRVHNARATREFRKYRFRYFFSLFPAASPQDYLAVARVSDRHPPTTLDELERAGVWLARFAEIPDATLREYLHRRWTALCERGTHLGQEAVAGLHARFAPAMTPAVQEGSA
jgi:glycosyltransferase involved in cell wall biosynthesis